MALGPRQVIAHGKPTDLQQAALTGAHNRENIAAAALAALAAGGTLAGIQSAIDTFQGLAHRAAELYAELELARSIVLQALQKIDEGEKDLSLVASAAKAKLWGTELQGRVTDKCLQLFGGYGFMTEYPISVAYADARVARIYGGTSEIMKTIISKDVLA